MLLNYSACWVIGELFLGSNKVKSNKEEIEKKNIYLNKAQYKSENNIGGRLQQTLRNSILASDTLVRQSADKDGEDNLERV